MKKIAENVFALIVFLGLIGCSVGPGGWRRTSSDSQSIAVIEDESLRGSAADFVANAGDRVFFVFDSSSISETSEAILEKQAAWLLANPGRRILIEGHCDERGTREYNLGLGERRADAAARYLVKNGVEKDRIRTISWGKDRPFAVEGTQEEVHRKNRVAVQTIE